MNANSKSICETGGGNKGLSKMMLMDGNKGVRAMIPKGIFQK